MQNDKFDVLRNLAAFQPKSKPFTLCSVFHSCLNGIINLLNVVVVVVVERLHDCCSWRGTHRSKDANALTSKSKCNPTNMTVTNIEVKDFCRMSL